VARITPDASRKEREESRLSLPRFFSKEDKAVPTWPKGGLLERGDVILLALAAILDITG